MAFKIVIADPKEGKTFQKEVESRALIGKKIGDEIDGSIVELEGFKLKITGGSDKCGFAMRHDVHGNAKQKILLRQGPAYHPKDDGIRRRKSVRGNTISLDVVQINMKVVEGPKALSEVFGADAE
ncbi:30S ribosomal protein S6e [Methanococcus voltae]|uniref:Small ribosomal subunit protein eS6 n=1 Tax=Methanococcus voltae (strain ATCC BAA-1334 / A3) TaxID=456320 RepID=D7DSG9_METV3|nr:30S ribosomal protein S6e [Methanococcus voltae]MCS3901605.1 small subunit ribosomal protein S6e [Methanococcus voltae]